MLLSFFSSSQTIFLVPLPGIMLFSIITFVALANVALAGTSHMVIDQKHWECAHIPSQEWTNHYCVGGAPHEESSDYQSYEELLEAAQKMSEATAHAAIEELHQADSTPDAAVTEALAIFALPDSLRVSLKELHLFTASASQVHEALAQTDDAPASVLAQTPIVPALTHACSSTPSCASTPCNIDCCSDANCPCRKDVEGGCSACACEKIAQVWYHKKSLIAKISGTCWKTTVEQSDAGGNKVTYKKSTVQMDVCSN